MQTKQPVPPGHLIADQVTISPTRRVGMRLVAPDAHCAYVAGSFNSWRPDATAMKSRGDGVWEAELELAPGDYEYRFIVDGRWVSDPLAGRSVANPFGDLNSVMHVAAR